MLFAIEIMKTAVSLQQLLSFTKFDTFNNNLKLLSRKRDINKNLNCNIYLFF